MHHPRTHHFRARSARAFALATLSSMLAAALALTACSGGPPPDPTAQLGPFPRVVGSPDADGVIVVDLRTRRAPDQGASIGVSHLVRVDPATGRTVFSDGTVMDADGLFAGAAPEGGRAYEYQRLDRLARTYALRTLSPEDQDRLRRLASDRTDERRAEARRERDAEEERRRQEHLAQAESRRREREAALAPIIEAGYEEHEPIAVPALGRGVAAIQRLEPATALAGRTWLLWPRRAGDGGPADPGLADPAPSMADLQRLATQATLVLDFGPRQRWTCELTVHDAGRSNTFDMGFEGGFLTEELSLRDDDLGRSPMWDGLPHPFGVSRTEGGHLVLTDGAMPPRAHGVLLPAPEGDGPALIAIQRGEGERWRQAVAQAHAAGRPVEHLEFPFWADERFVSPDDQERRLALRFVRAVYERSTDLRTVMEPMTSWAQPHEQVFANYATAFEMVWHQARPQPDEPINVYQYTADGYRIINNWGTVTESQAAIAEVVKIRTRYADLAEPAFKQAMKRGPIIDQRATTLKLRTAARLFYDLYPPGSPTAERFEANLYHYLANGL